MTGPPTVRVVLTSRAENVALIRAVLTGLAEVVEFGSAFDDIKVAVSEACNNVVVHAYGDGEGALEVDISLLRGELEVVVRDYGRGGIASGSGGDGELRGESQHGGLGLTVIEALADRVELREPDPNGTEVVMGFAVPTLVDLPETEREPLDTPGFDALAAKSDAVQITIAPAALGSAVLSRVVSATAARAGFSIDRLSDAQLVADALTAHIEPELSGSGISIGLAVGARKLEMELGPLKPGGSRSAVAESSIGGVGPLIEHLADEVEVRTVGPEEVLKLVLVDKRPTGTSV
jgi:serine/threonine-protein kinase RsbW